MSEIKFKKLCEIDYGDRKIVITYNPSVYDTEEKLTQLKEFIEKNVVRGGKVRWYV